MKKRYLIELKENYISFFLRMMLKDFENGEIPLTNKQKS